MKIKYWDETDLPVKVISKYRDLKVGIFENCTIEGHNVYYPQPLIRTGNELLLPTIERFMSLGRGTVYEDNMEWNCKDKKVKNVVREPVFYFVYNCANYFHWIYDTVPYLHSYFIERERIPDLKILMSPTQSEKDLYPFVYETLELLGIYKKDILFLNEETEYKTMIIGSSLTHNRMSLEPPHPGLFSIVNSMEGSDSSLDKIYVSRRTWTQKESSNIGTDYTKQRMCMNEDELVNYLVSKGYKEIFCENYSMKEKIGIFRNAKSVVGPCGGGMCNIIFCSSDTKVLSINSPEFYPTNERLKNAMNHTKIRMFDHTKFHKLIEEQIVDRNALSISGGLNSPWLIDMDRFIDTFESSSEYI